MIMAVMVVAINTAKLLEAETIVVAAETTAAVVVETTEVAVAETIAAAAEITTTGILKKDINNQSELKQHLPREVLFFKK